MMQIIPNATPERSSEERSLNLLKNMAIENRHP
jgi:hypothetical protein